jgi:multidrug resistance efflux pump
VLRSLGSPLAGVPTFEVARGGFIHRVHADGNLRAVEATLLGPPPEVDMALKIAWLAPDGSFVHEGEVVIRFDPTEMEENLRSGQHDRDAADSRITRRETLEESSKHALEVDAHVAGLELDYAREFQSKDTQIFSRVEIIESEIDEDLATERKSHAEEAGGTHSALAASELELLAIEKRKAQIKIDQARRGLERLEVRAPHDGTFVLKQHWSGVPEVGQTVWGGQPLAEIPRLEQIEARVFVLEADAGGLEPGLPATVMVDAFPERTWQAKVAQVDTLAERRNHRVPVQYFGVTLALETTDLERMKPGGRVQAVITMAELDDAVWIPRQAVFERDGARVAYVARAGAFEPVELALGQASLGRVVVERGLEPGQRIALRDPLRPAGAAAEATREERGRSSGPLRGRR